MMSSTFSKLTAAAAVLALGACGQSTQQAASDSAPKQAVSPAIAQDSGVRQISGPVIASAVAAAQASSAFPHTQAGAALPPATHLMPAGHPTDQSNQLVIRGFAAKLPDAWIPTQPSSSMRVAQFNIPPAKGADPGEVAVFYFPPGQGGSHQANIERWASQFSGPGGLPVMPQTSVSKSGNTEVTLVELHGSYARGVGMGPEGEAKPDQTLLVAMVEAPIGRITMQMYGPSKTVAVQRDNFLKLAKGFRPT